MGAAAPCAAAGSPVSGQGGIVTQRGGSAGAGDRCRCQRVELTGRSWGGVAGERRFLRPESSAVAPAEPSPQGPASLEREKLRRTRQITPVLQQRESLG